MPTRREFLTAAAATLGAGCGQASRMARIEIDGETGFQEELARKELMRGLERLGPHSGRRFRLRVERSLAGGPEAYRIASAGDEVVLTGGSSQGLLHSVYEFLERQGAFFGIDGESYPLDAPDRLRLPPESQPWTGAPRFGVRGLLPWPDFLNCISVYNEEDFLAYFEAMLRMRLNMFGMHVYTGGRQWAESYLSFEFAGVGHLAFLDNSGSHRWGYLPQRTSSFTMGGDQFYDREVFGSDATRLARDPWERAEATRTLLRKAFAYAGRLGIRTGIGFEPYQIPDEIWRALPPEVRPARLPERGTAGERFDIESVTARKLLETRLAQLLEAYPNANYVWLWEDEQMNWESRRTGTPLSVTPFVQAHDFLRRHAPKKRLVLAGWGGVARHFEYFHRKLPEDVIFSCLSDSLGWDPVHEVFGQLGDRERWPIPWLEDDPGMWQAQFHAHRFQRDVNLSAGYGCQGMLGIHWRHRIVDPTAGYFARSMWDAKLVPGDYYRTYAATQAAGPRAGQLASILTSVDRHNKLLSTFSGEGEEGHAITRQFSGDYNEAFTYWRDYTPDPATVASQKEVLAALQELGNNAASPVERERLGYLAGHVEFLVPYAESWTLANRIHGVLGRASKLEKAAAGELVRTEAVPVWLQLAGEVRRSMLAFQRIVATRNDLGTLASKHNKFVRLALYRLPLSIQEYVGEMPASIEERFAEVVAPDPDAATRLFLPTRPGLLARRTKTRIMIIAPGAHPVAEVRAHVRLGRSGKWRATDATLLGRQTWEGFLGPFAGKADLAEYFVSAKVAGTEVRTGTHLITLI